MTAAATPRHTPPRVVTLHAAAPLTRHPLPTRAEALTIAAFHALIDRALAAKDELLPFGAARRLADDLHQSGLMDIIHDGSAATVTLAGVTARTTGQSHAVLTEWQRAAAAHLAQGVR